MAESEIHGDLFCQECGYNLRGLTSNRCPECGCSVDALRSEVSCLPWVYRDTIGRMRAYWQTVCFVMFRHKRFCEEVSRPVDYADAQRFRWVTVLHVYLPILAATILLYFLFWLTPSEDSSLNQVFREVWPVVMIHVCILLFLAAATGVPSYFFHPRDISVEQQNRAIALSYYACAALAWTPLALMALTIGLIMIHVNRNVGEVFIALAFFLPIGQLIAYELDLSHIGVRIMPQHKLRLALLGIGLPVFWLGLAGLIFFVIPFVVCYVAIFVGRLS